jgi:hypothetical protein
MRSGVLHCVMPLTDRTVQAPTIGVRERDMQLTDRIDFTTHASEESACVRKRIACCSPLTDS